MDILSALAGSLFNDPRLKAVLDDIPGYAAEWKRVVSILKFLEMSAASHDDRLAYLIAELDKANERLVLIMSETHLSPDLHEAALAMAGADPRNQSSA